MIDAARAERRHPPIPHAEFDELYQGTVRRVLSHWTPSIQESIAEHNVAWGPGKFDFREYLVDSSIRFYHAYRYLSQRGTQQRVGDIGGLWGVFPLTLRELGFEVVMTETLKYYNRCFDPIFKLISDEGVTIVDYDPFDESAVLPLKFDFVSVMAVLEHYPHSLKPFMHNVKSTMADGARMYLEVPNIAAWPRRFALLRGRTPHPPIADIFHSRTPFIGHHHEYTMAELCELAALSGLRVTDKLFYDYSTLHNTSPLRWLRNQMRRLIGRVARSCRDSVAVLCEDDANAAAERIAA